MSNIHKWPGIVMSKMTFSWTSENLRPYNGSPAPECNNKTKLIW